jgi:Protein of unknown function (DUF3465)
MKRNTIQKIILAMCLVLSFSACRAPTNNSAGAQSADANIESVPVSSPTAASSHLDAGAITEAYGARRNLPQVQGSGVVTKVLKDDTKGLKHQKFLLKVSDNITILIAHNIDLAPRVDDIKAGDVVEFKGEYIYTPKGGTVHWTHKDPRGHHIAGWLKNNGKTYE